MAKQVVISLFDDEAAADSAAAALKGAGIGFVPALLGPIGVGIGATAGGAFGMLHHKGLGLSERHRDLICAELALGKAAVGVLAGDDEAPSIDAKLTELGGRSEVHAFSDEALEEAAVAAAAPPASA